MTHRIRAAALGLLSVGIFAAPAPAPAAIIGYWTEMDGASEHDPNTSPGTGQAFVTYDNVAHTARIQANFTGLQGTTTAAHIHAPTAEPFAGTAGVATQTPSFTGFPLGVTSGTMDHTFDLTQASSWNAAYITANGGTPAGAEAAFFSAMDAGRAYFNIHTTSFGAGEIRGFLVVPEPGALTLLGVAAALLTTTRRRRRSTARGLSLFPSARAPG